MTVQRRSHIRALRRAGLVVVAAGALAACSSGASATRSASGHPTTTHGKSAAHSRAGTGSPSSTPPSRSSAARVPGEFTISFAGDVHFAGRIGDRLDRDPTTVFGEAQPGLAAADLTMVNLETAVTDGGVQQNKEFTFRAPPRALVALRDAGIDLATMANNHGADYGAQGLQDSLAASRQYRFPIIGIGANAAAAYAPYTTTLNGTKVAIIAADQVQDETTLRLFSAGPSTPGVANAFSPLLIDSVRRAKAAGYVVIVYVHWGIEYETCPSSNQTQLAGQLADAGANAVIGTHAHVLQGDGWRKNGTFVAYGLGNYLWWRSFGNNQDDNGVLTLHFQDGRVRAAPFAPSQLDDRGVPVPATGANRARILAELAQDRGCTDLSASPPPLP